MRVEEPTPALLLLLLLAEEMMEGRDWRYFPTRGLNPKENLPASEEFVGLLLPAATGTLIATTPAPSPPSLPLPSSSASRLRTADTMASRLTWR